jgi:hypothetical protein
MFFRLVQYIANKLRSDLTMSGKARAQLNFRLVQYIANKLRSDLTMSGKARAQLNFGVQMPSGTPKTYAAITSVADVPSRMQCVRSLQRFTAFAAVN